MKASKPFFEISNATFDELFLTKLFNSLNPDGERTLPIVRFVVRRVFLLLSICIFVGCSYSSLYTNLEETEAVEMQAILLREGIDCDKIAGKEDTWELRVAKNHLAEAVETLKSFGHPKEKFVNMGEMFEKAGLVSSPLEERIRYIYALSQEVAQTISKIDGIITARVHIVLPANDPLSEYFQPSSASVFVKHRQTIDIQSRIHQIKQLVVNSIEGLNYDKVSVAPFASALVETEPLKYTRIMGIEVISAFASRFRLLVFGLIFFLALTMSGCLYLLWQNQRKDQSSNKMLQKQDQHGRLLS